MYIHPLTLQIVSVDGNWVHISDPSLVLKNPKQTEMIAAVLLEVIGSIFTCMREHKLFGPSRERINGGALTHTTNGDEFNILYATIEDAAAKARAYLEKQLPAHTLQIQGQGILSNAPASWSWPDISQGLDVCRIKDGQVGIRWYAQINKGSTEIRCYRSLSWTTEDVSTYGQKNKVKPVKASAHATSDKVPSPSSIGMEGRTLEEFLNDLASTSVGKQLGNESIRRISKAVNDARGRPNSYAAAIRTARDEAPTVGALLLSFIDWQSNQTIIDIAAQSSIREAVCRAREPLCKKRPAPPDENFSGTTDNSARTRFSTQPDGGSGQRGPRRQRTMFAPPSTTPTPASQIAPLTAFPSLPFTGNLANSDGVRPSDESRSSKLNPPTWRY